MGTEPGPMHHRVTAGRRPDLDLIEYVVLRTSDLSSSEALAPFLRALSETSQITIIDLVGVQIDALGEYRVVGSELLPGVPMSDPDVGVVLSDDDIALVCGALGPNSSALILVAEDRWAQPFADAARISGGRIVGGERIPRRSIEQSQRSRTRDLQEGLTTGPRGGRSRRQRVDLLRRRPFLDDSIPVEPSG